ncbi:MAG: polysaccharide biosynthesis C-terminal domain-containing protein [Bacteroidales bacterium]|nr:polysaccharide biosynthesis C-terminal domain-containing protein [Bacteroidales bacterium]MBN2748812.1 polysaccharide biosynthesis C-terminal domain-containing protein [Bacteroidales bacterium]
MPQLFSVSRTFALQLFQAIRFLSLIGISIFLSKSGLSQEEIGSYETVLFVAGLLSFFWVSGLTQAMLASTAPRVKDKGSEIFNTFIVLSTFTLATVATGYLLKSSITALKGTSNLEHLTLTLLYLALSAPANLAEYIYLIKNKPRSIVAYGSIVWGAQLLAVIAAVHLGHGLAGAIYALIASAGIKLIWTVALVVKHSELKLNIKFIREFLLLGIPLVGKILISGSASYIDGLIITSQFSLSAFATFRFGAREFPLTTLLSNGLSNAMIPDLASPSNFAKALINLKKRTLRLMHVLYPITIVSLLVAPPLFPIVFNPSFAASAIIFNTYLLTITSKLIFPQTVAIGLKKTKWLLYISIAELSINVSLSLALIPPFGLNGVAIATVIAFWFEKALIALYLYRALNIAPQSYIPLKEYFIYSTLLLLTFAISTVIWF